MSTFLLVCILAGVVVNMALLASIPTIVEETIKRELRRLFEGEYDG